MVGVAGERVDVRQQRIPQAAVVGHARIIRRAFRGDVPDLAERELAVRAEQRHERAELEPARVELAPFALVRRVLVFVAFFHRETADVESPVRQAGHGDVDAGGNLVAHVVPTRDDVAAPHRHRIALGAGIALAREDEHALAVGGAIAFVDAMGVRQRVGIEELGGRTQRGRRGPRLALADVQVGVHVRLVGVHPPGIEALAVELVVDLAPVDRLRVGRIRVVERVLVALTDPVQFADFDVALVHVPGGGEFLVVGSGRIELRPDRDHDLRVHGVHRRDHAVRIGEMRLVEVVRAPCVLRPVRPVEHDVVDRQLALAVLGQRGDQFVLALVAFAALPETVSPLRQQHRLAGQFAIPGDDLIGVGAGDDVIVDHLPGLGPQRQVLGLGRRQRVAVQQRDVAGIDQVPLDLELVPLARLQREGELVVPRVPVLAPAVDHQFAVDPQLGVLAGVQREAVLAAAAGLDLAFPADLHAALVAGLGLGRELGQVPEVLVIDFLLAALQHLLAVD